jgi:hypothetical protein
MATYEYNPNTGARLNPGEKVWDIANNRLITQGQEYGSGSAYTSANNVAVGGAPATPATPTNLSQAQLDTIEAQIANIRNQTNAIAPKVQEVAASTLKTPTYTMPGKAQDTTPYAGIASGATSAIDTYTKNMKDLMASFAANAPEPPDTTDIYNQLVEQFGLAGKQTAVNEKQAAVQTATNELNNINAQIQAVNNEAEAASLQLENNAATGADITSTFLGRQQTEISRNAAIKALPLQSQALVASAKVSAAQGDAQLAQDQLTQAQDNITRLYSIQAENAQTNYQYKMDLYKSLYSFATDIQKTQLEAKTAEETRAYEQYNQNLSVAQDYAKMAISTGQGSLATQITALDANNPNFQTRLAELAGQIQAPTEDVKTSIANVNGRSVLINTQTGETIKDLGIANSEISQAGGGGTNDDYSRALQFVNDNPDATPQELEQNIRANTNLSEADIKSLVKTKSTLTRETISKMFGIEDNDNKSGFLGLWGETNREKLDNIMNTITQYQNVGYTDQEILKMMQ